MPEVRVLIVDDHAILRDGIRSLLERQDDIVVVGEAGNGLEALSQVSALLPDIVLMDIAMPGMNGIEATHQIKELYPDVKILVLTQHDNREYIEPLLQAGASGYILKRSGGKEVVNAIRHVYEDSGYLEPGIAQKIISDYRQQKTSLLEETPHLTTREKQILNLTISGKSNKEIAQSLGISPKTVSVHRSNIMSKLDVHNSFELIHYVTRHPELSDNTAPIKPIITEEN